MKTILSAVLFASFLLSGPAASLAGEAETKKAEKTEKKDEKAPDKGATKKGETTTADGAKLRGR
jgi:hypothetical protein